MQDKYKALWLSHSSINDFLKCPRAYYFNNVYKNPETNRKISIINPHLALGQVIHDVLESLYDLPSSKRFDMPLKVLYEVKWRKISGKLGGFKNDKEEAEFKKRGLEMLKKVEANPGPLADKAIKINMDLPWFFLSEPDNIILCGKIDWIKYNSDDDTVNIIDFKTGKYEENENSLQFAIYRLLLENCQKRIVNKACYWYLKKGEIKNFDLPSSNEAYQSIMQIAKKIKQARKNKEFDCEKGGCYACEPFDKIISGKAEMVKIDNYKREIYVV